MSKKSRAKDNTPMDANQRDKDRNNYSRRGTSGSRCLKEAFKANRLREAE